MTVTDPSFEPVLLLVGLPREGSLSAITLIRLANCDKRMQSCISAEGSKVGYLNEFSISKSRHKRC